MPKLDLTRALRIKSSNGEISRLKGSTFLWSIPSQVEGQPINVYNMSYYQIFGSSVPGKQSVINTSLYHIYGSYISGKQSMLNLSAYLIEFP